MYKNKKIIAVITARGGSKGVPRKNIRDLAGKPLIAYSIEHCRASKYIDVFVTSSQDNEILDVAKKYGSEVVLRPHELAEDTTPTPPCLLHAVDEVAKKFGLNADLVITVQPTSPLRENDTIDRLIEFMVDGGYDSAMTVHEERHPFGKIENNTFIFLDPARRRQDRTPLFRENGAAYVTDVGLIRELKVLGGNIGILPSSDEESLDIDTLQDFALAEILMKQRFATGSASVSPTYFAPQSITPPPMKPPMQSLQIGKVTIGPNHPVVMIAEGCDNHNGSLAKAKEIAHSAKESGADIIKFQMHIPDEEMHKMETERTSSQMFSKWGSLYGFVEANRLPVDDHKELMDFCNKIGIQYLCTPFSLKAAQLLNEMGAEAFKIGSGETEDMPFIEETAKFRKPMIISTGMSTWEEITHTVDEVQKIGAPLSLAHCISVYSPKNAYQLHLGVIAELCDRFNVPVGLSDHTAPEGVHSRAGHDVSQQAEMFAAIALGACFIEKHFTLDRNQPDADSVFSLDPKALRTLVLDIRAAEESMSRERIIFEEEKPVWIWAKRSLVAAGRIAKDEVITREKITSKRPGTGIRSKFYREVMGKTARRDIEAGEMLQWGDIN